MLFLGLQAVAPLAAEVRVAAAVSLQRPLQELGERHPMRVQWGGSVLLAHQLLQGAPADLFVTADAREIDRLVAAGLVESSRRCTLASNRIAVVVARGGTRPTVVGDLLQLKRVAIANAANAPLGRYTAQALSRLGVELGRRAIPAAHARQTVEYVARGEVDAAIVYRSDALRFSDRVEIALLLPAEAHEAIRYEAALLASTERTEALFTEICNDEALFLRHGFSEWPGQR
jgi:molybdate transport system substrate-binding protein